MPMEIILEQGAALGAAELHESVKGKLDERLAVAIAARRALAAAHIDAPLGDGETRAIEAGKRHEFVERSGRIDLGGGGDRNGAVVRQERQRCSLILRRG